jgi:hypothetical protein
MGQFPTIGDYSMIEKRGTKYIADKKAVLWPDV